MGEFTEDGQIDFIKHEENVGQARRALRRAGERMGFGILAHILDLAVNTLRLQMNWAPRTDKKDAVWKPSADAFIEVFLRDRQLREELLALCKERIAPIEDLDPEEAMREVMAQAKSLRFGTDCATVVGEIYRRMKKGGAR